jgi:hypothetical protein
MSVLAGESVERRMEKIDSLLNALTGEVSELKKSLDTLSAAQARPADSDTGDTKAAAVLLPETQQKIMASRPLNFQTTALGFAIAHHLGQEGNDYVYEVYEYFDENEEQYFHLGFTFLHWLNKWGVRFTGGAAISNRIDYAFASVACLRSIKRFYFGDYEFTHIFALAEIGNTYRQFYYWPQQSTPGYAYDDSETYAKVYSKGNNSIHAMIGFGTDFNTFDGWKISPEVGYRVNYYTSRYQDSKEWPQNVSPGAPQPQRPKSDISVNVAFGVNMYIFFR